MNFAPENIARRIKEFFLWLWAIKYILGPLFLVLVLIFLIRKCENFFAWREVKQHIENADRHNENKEALEADRDKINQTAERDRQNIDAQGQQQNENQNRALSNLNSINANLPANVSGAELDAAAKRYANRNTAAGGNW